MAESTCGCAMVSVCPQRSSLTFLSVESSFQSLQSFRIADLSTDTDLKTNITKSNERESLFPEIYLIPESLMGLLSQTMVNEQELLHRDTFLNADILMHLNSRAKVVEQQILSWKPTSSDVSMREEGTGQTNGEETGRNASEYMALAVHQSLILFYYRRVQ
ncbi:uncharacterized protein BO97DRAFT_423236 [Aspergillus homomorphus CBS 101889]|uniref:Uncharacterized protein n=1 Tax=Aspergillus homomorphus (strain CBS 101889) TaxID=1450537 RepID=A0A395I2G3_ASPHC|nr:hypothetical protein BO97DRAFT_423236 [Aspergillus homomorphus CBS 101889]RAL13853.1 hypothetical protein BO97DRAFT_423236 [Aspergillus homomorphus CBS 101889]